jgi:4-methylaminobutanoate oxidase (formaldehyde-forming)
MLYHGEPIWRDGKLVGRLTSGMFGHTVGRPIGLGYVENGGQVVSDAYVAQGKFEIEIAGDRIAAKAALGALYDPKSERVKT